MQEYRRVKQRVQFRARDCCYRCLLPQKVCQPHSQGGDCLDPDLLGVFLVQMARAPRTISEILPDSGAFSEGLAELEAIQVAMRMIEVDQELLGTETPKVVILFLHFCSRFQDQSEARGYGAR